MESRHCVVCYKDISGTPSVVDCSNGIAIENVNNSTHQGKEECTLLKNQLPVIFLLQKFLEIPKEVCAQYLQDYGNPCSWVQWCDSCSILVKRAKICFREIASLQKQLEGLRTELKNIICKSEKSRLLESEDIMLLRQLKCTSGNRLTDIIRSFIMKNGTINHETESEPQVKVKVEQFYSDYEEDDSFNPQSEFSPMVQVEGKAKLKLFPSSIENSVQKGKLKKPPRKHIGHNKGRKSRPVRKNIPKNKVYQRKTKVLPPAENSDNEPEHFEDDNDSPSSDKDLQPEYKNKVEDEERHLKCKLCPKRFKNPNCLRMHLKRHIAPEDRPHACDVCGKRFLTLLYLKEHSVSHTKERPYSCAACGKTFRQECSLFRHKKEQECGVVRQCSMCHETFNQTTKLVKHVSTAHRKDMESKNTRYKVQCPICSKVISRIHDLKRHLATHSEERPHPCPTCGKMFKHSSEVTAHLRITHSGQKYSCSICERKFKTKSQVQLHELRIHSDQPRERNSLCTICGKAFFDKFGLNSHLLTHSEEKKLSCTICEYKCNVTDKLKRHLLTHTGERPYPCTLCSKAFPTMQQVKLHLRVHTGEKPYLCNVCGKSFADRNNLNKHSRIHERDVLGS